jgi:hypothetical protein
MTQSKDDKDIVFDITTSDSITINMNDLYDATDCLTINTDTVMCDTVDINTLTSNDNIDLDWISSITLDRVMFEDYMPEPGTLKLMAEQYPALKKAYENFKTIYKMVEQDWKGNHADDDEELPF